MTTVDVDDAAAPRDFGFMSLPPVPPEFFDLLPDDELDPWEQ